MASTSTSRRRSSMLVPASVVVVVIGVVVWVRLHDRQRSSMVAPVTENDDARPAQPASALASTSDEMIPSTSSNRPDAKVMTDDSAPAGEAPSQVTATTGRESIYDSSRVILVGRFIGLDCLEWPPRGVSLVARWGNAMTGLEWSEEPGCWFALVPAATTMSIRAESPVRSFPDQELSSVEVILRDGVPSYEVPAEAQWGLPFALESVTIDVSTRFNIERMTVTPALGAYCEGLVGVLDDPATGETARIESADVNTLTVITLAADEVRTVVVQSCGMADAEHVWIAEAGCRDVPFALYVGQEARIKLPVPPSTDATELAFGVMLCRKAADAAWNSLTTDGTDRRGKARNYAFFPDASNEVVVSLPNGNGSVGICGVLGKVHPSGTIQVIWRSPRTMPIVAEPGQSKAVQCNDDLWRGWHN